MSATSQLEVYKIILPSKTTFGDLVQGKFYAEKSPQQTDFAKFKKLYKAFLEKLIKNNVWEYKDKKKGLTVFRQEPNSLNKNDFHKIKISLKRAILITLALEYRKDENKSFTTTEISYWVNQHFKDSKRSKNNVRRYFNQSIFIMR